MNPVQENVKCVSNPFLDALAKLQKATISFVFSVCPSTSLSALPLDGFSLNLIFDDLLKMYQQNSIR